MTVVTKMLFLDSWNVCFIWRVRTRWASVTFWVKMSYMCGWSKSCWCVRAKKMNVSENIFSINVKKLFIILFMLLSACLWSFNINDWIPHYENWPRSLLFQSIKNKKHNGAFLLFSETKGSFKTFNNLVWWECVDNELD